MTTTKENTTIASLSEMDEAVMEQVERQLKLARNPLKRIRLRALVTANKIRMAAGRSPLADLPKGVVNDSMDCPLYRALEGVGIDEINGDRHLTFSGSGADQELVRRIGETLNGGSGEHIVESWTADADESTVVLTGREFEDFVQAFDRGEFRDLVEGEDDVEDE